MLRMLNTAFSFLHMSTKSEVCVAFQSKVKKLRHSSCLRNKWICDLKIDHYYNLHETQLTSSILGFPRLRTGTDGKDV